MQDNKINLLNFLFLMIIKYLLLNIYIMFLLFS